VSDDEAGMWRLWGDAMLAVMEGVTGPCVGRQRQIHLN